MHVCGHWFALPEGSNIYVPYAPEAHLARDAGLLCCLCHFQSQEEELLPPCTTEQTEEASFCRSSGGSLGLNLYMGQWWSFLSYSTCMWVATLKFSKWDTFIEFTKNIKMPWRCKSINWTLKSKFPNWTPSCKIYLRDFEMLGQVGMASVSSRCCYDKTPRNSRSLFFIIFIGRSRQ